MKALLPLLLLVFAGCITNPETGEVEADWPTISKEIDLASQDAADVAELLAEDEPDFAEDLAKLAALGEKVHEGIDLALETGEEGDVLDVLDAALKEADTLYEAATGKEFNPKAAAAVFVLRSILRRARTYATD